MKTSFSPRGVSQRRRHLGRTLGAVVTAALLAGCARTTAPPEGAPRALVYGAVSSPVYDALTGKMTLTLSDGRQRATDYDLVIVDGDSFTGEGLRNEEALHAAVRNGAWVLGLDVAEDDKQVGLGASLNAATPGASPAYLARQTRGQGGHQVNTFIDFARSPGPPEEQARQILGYLGLGKLTAPRAEPWQVGARQQGPTNIPGRLLTVDYRLIDPATQVVMLPNSNPAYLPPYADPPSQTATWQANHFISVFLDAGTNPQGNFQHVVVETEGLGNPGPLTINNINSASWPAGMSEIAYIQTQFTSTHAISPGSTPENSLAVVQTSPTNANNTTNVTTGLSFGISYSVDSGVTGSFGYSDSVTNNITDWGLTNDSTTSQAVWSLYSQNPYNGQAGYGLDDSAWFYYFEGVTPKTPNGLSLYENEYDMQSHWTNGAVSSDWVTVSGTDTGWYTDAYTVTPELDNNPTGNAPKCYYDAWIAECALTQHLFRSVVSKPWSLRINMAAVVPVPVQAITFTPNPVAAGQPTTATVTLAAPTPIDAVVNIASQTSGVAAPNGSYTVPAGQGSVSFPVNTGCQGNQPSSATITAFYANLRNAILNIDPGPGC